MESTSLFLILIIFAIGSVTSFYYAFSFATKSLKKHNNENIRKDKKNTQD